MAAAVLFGATYLALRPSSSKSTPKKPEQKSSPNEILANLKAQGLDNAKMVVAHDATTLESDYFLKLLNFIGLTVTE